MSPNEPNAPTPPPGGLSAPPLPKKRRWLLWGCGGLLAFALLIVATVAITLWWIQRPIKPVVLSPKEKATVEAKIRTLEDEQPARPPTSPPAQAAPSTPVPPPRSTELAELPRAYPVPGSTPEPDRSYTPGDKVLKLTEREINGLLNQNTDLGNTVRLEFGRDAINAYLAVPIPKDFPIGGGKMFRARGRFRVSIGNGGAPYAILDDVTVFGLSLPKAWLGGLKGENLLGDVLRDRNGSPALRGIKSLRVEPGALVLELND